MRKGSGLSKGAAAFPPRKKSIPRTRAAAVRYRRSMPSFALSRGSEHYQSFLDLLFDYSMTLID